MCTDGITRTVNVDKSLNYPTGWLVEIKRDPRRGAGDRHRVQNGQRHHQRTATALGDYCWPMTYKFWIRHRRVWLGRFVPAD